MTPGVYAIWDMRSRVVIYVGETSCLRDRLADLGRWHNHTCRRKLAVELGFRRTQARELSSAMAARYALRFIEVPFGRTELEEFLRLRWRQTLINSPSKRLLRGPHYGWVAVEEHHRARPAVD